MAPHASMESPKSLVSLGFTETRGSSAPASFTGKPTSSIVDKSAEALKFMVQLRFTAMQPSPGMRGSMGMPGYREMLRSMAMSISEDSL